MGHLSPRGFILWHSVPHIVCWSIWAERNLRVFEVKSSPSTVLKERAFGLLFRWTAHLPEFMGCNFSFWVFEWDTLVFR